jgi:hypothetical protein
MVREHPVLVGKRRLIQQGDEPIGEVPWMDQHNRLAGTLDYILQFDARKHRPFPASLVHTLPP